MAQETGAHYNVTVARPTAIDPVEVEATFYRNQNVLRGWFCLPGKTSWIIELCARDKVDAFDKAVDMLPGFTITAMSERTMAPARTAAPVPA